MLKNYIVIAWRNLLRNKFHTAINILGLAVGLSACLVIYLIVSFELSFNKGHAGAERIYRIHSSFTGQFSGLNRGVPTAVVPAMRDQFTGVESIAPAHAFNAKVRHQGSPEGFDIPTALILTEPSWFEVFSSYQWLAGSPAVLAEPFQVVLTETSAQRYFGHTNPNEIIGKEIIYRDSLPVTVGGLVKDLSFTTDIDFSDFISLSTVEQSWLKNTIQLNDWSSVNSSSQAFLKLNNGTDVSKIVDQLPLLSKLHKENSSWDVDNQFKMQALSDLHYNADTGIFDHSRSPAHMPTLLSLIGVAALLLLIGAINFINLETAQSLRRAKEVGVRKVLGGTQRTLIAQFLSESLIITFFSIVLALPLTELALGYFSEFVPNGVELNVIHIVPALLMLTLSIGIMAGLYPAFVLSSFLPVHALKNQGYTAGQLSNAPFLRKVLIVFQFSFAQLLILGTLVVNHQIRYLIDKDLGFDREAVVYIDMPWWENREKAKALKAELEQIPQIHAISMSESPPSYNGWSSSTITFRTDSDEIKMSAFRKFGDSNYIGFYNIPLLAGRNLQESDTVKEFLINETLAKTLGFQNPEDAIDHVIEYGQKNQIPIVGVVKDFHTKSLRHGIDPVIMANAGKSFGCFNVRFNTGNESSKIIADGIANIEAAWKKVFPESEIRYQFLDETIKNFYKTEQRTAKLANAATGLAIVISCLGLFGIVSYTTVQRTKEIGIRKVLGASVQNIVLLLSGNFIMLVMVAFVLSAPIAWYLADNWLENFAYHIQVGYLTFAATILVAVVIAFITVGLKTLQAAQANPVESLRNE
jgi:putative ABC transport system permease protein